MSAVTRDPLRGRSSTFGTRPPAPPRADRPDILLASSGPLRSQAAADSDHGRCGHSSASSPIGFRRRARNARAAGRPAPIKAHDAEGLPMPSGHGARPSAGASVTASIGNRRARQASTPPASGRTRMTPCRFSPSATLALVAWLGQLQCRTTSASRASPAPSCVSCSGGTRRAPGIMTALDVKAFPYMRSRMSGRPPRSTSALSSSAVMRSVFSVARNRRR